MSILENAYPSNEGKYNWFCAILPLVAIYHFRQVNKEKMLFAIVFSHEHSFKWSYDFFINEVKWVMNLSQESVSINERWNTALG